MYKTYNRAIINCKNMATETRKINANRFDPNIWCMQSFVLLVNCFVFMFFFPCMFCILKFLSSKILFSMIFREFHFLLEFCEHFLFSVSRKLGTLVLYQACSNVCMLHYICKHIIKTWQMKCPCCKNIE